MAASMRIKDTRACGLVKGPSRLPRDREGLGGTVGTGRVEIGRWCCHEKDRGVTDGAGEGESMGGKD